MLNIAKEKTPTQMSVGVTRTLLSAQNTGDKA